MASAVVSNSDSNLRVGVAVARVAWGRADAREVDFVGATLVVVAFELVDHEGVVPVLEDRDVLKLSQEDWDFRGRDKETCEEHEGDD